VKVSGQRTTEGEWGERGDWGELAEWEKSGEPVMVGRLTTVGYEPHFSSPIDVPDSSCCQSRQSASAASTNSSKLTGFCT